MAERKPLKETVEEMESARLISVVYSEEFLEVFMALDNVVKSYRDMMDIWGPIQTADYILDQYKKKFNLQPEDFE